MQNKKKKIFFSQAINQALVKSMKKNNNVLLIGLGVDDPKGIFETTKGINKIFKTLFWGGGKGIKDTAL